MINLSLFSAVTIFGLVLLVFAIIVVIVFAIGRDVGRRDVLNTLREWYKSELESGDEQS